MDRTGPLSDRQAVVVRNASHDIPRLLALRRALLLSILLMSQTVSATTYISVEPIPSVDVVGQPDLDTILDAGYSNLERWSNLLLNNCMMVDAWPVCLRPMALSPRSMAATPRFLWLPEDLRAPPITQWSGRQDIL